MADLVALGSGNFLDAATWGVVDVPSRGWSAGFAVAGTVAVKDSSTFVPSAVSILGIVLRVTFRTAGTPTNTVTVTLRNSTTATDIQTVVANVSDLPAAATGSDSEGGWHFFKFATPHTPNGTDSYVVRFNISSTSTNLSFASVANGSNIARFLVTATTQAPAAGDGLYLAQFLDGAANPATPSGMTVTMNSVTATDYGTTFTSTDQTENVMSVSKGCTLAFGTAASTDYVLRLSGNMAVYSGGTFTIGTVATPIPRTSTAILEFDLTATNSMWGLQCLRGSTVTMQGLSRTVGKDAVWALLTANLAAAGVAATIDTDTGWLNGDEVGFATTTRTAAQCESVALNANATATGLAWTGGVANAHAGSLTEPMQAEVVLLTRNVRVRGTVAANGVCCRADTTAILDIDWVDFRYLASEFGRAGWSLKTTTGGSVSFEYCVLRDSRQQSVLDVVGPAGTGTVVIQHCVGWKGSRDFLSLPNASTNSTHLYHDLVAINFVGAGTAAMDVVSCDAGAYTNWRVVAGGNTACIRVIPQASGGTGGAGKVLGPFVIHSGGAAGLTLHGASGPFSHLHFADLLVWRNNGVGVSIQGIWHQTHWERLRAWGNNINLEFGTSSAVDCFGMVFDELELAGDSAFTSSGLVCSGFSVTLELFVRKGDFGTPSGVKVANLTQDILLSSQSNVRAYLNNCLFTAAALFSPTTLYGAFGSRWHFSRFNRTSGDFRTYTPPGLVRRETTTTDTGAGLKLTPLSATVKLTSSAQTPGRGFLVPISNGQAATVTVKVRKDATYNGNAPRLLCLASSGVGLGVDTVGDTMTVGADTWETLTYTTPAVTDDGVLEFVVDCDGTAGNVFVDTWTAA